MIENFKIFIKYSKEFFHDILILRKVQNNQKDIIKISNPKGNALNIMWNPLVTGNVGRYYHFIFDLLLPFSAIIENTPSTTLYYIKDIGPLTKELLSLFGDRVRIIEAHGNNKEHMILGMNPNGLNVLNFSFDVLRKAAFAKFEINKTTGTRKILLIERGPPDSYYLTIDNNKQSGNLRRSIVNHRAFEALISSEISDEYEFQNLMLEDLNLEEQIRCFNSADLVIAQHGAGLANIIWMEKGASVIELGYQSRSHFEKVCASKKLDFIRYKDYIEDHISVDIDDFRSWLSSNRRLRRFFKN